MRCPFCGIVDRDHVLDSRPIREGAAIRRRRVCDACLGRFTTFEEIEELRPMVQKRNGAVEGFDREKLLRAVEVACRKRPVSAADLEALVEDIERQLHARTDREIPSSEIGEMVMDRLRDLDQVAYVRFASVYRQFEDAQQFKAIAELLRPRRRSPNS
jgi:transcriptional repressor NrdR